MVAVRQGYRQSETEKNARKTAESANQEGEELLDRANEYVDQIKVNTRLLCDVMTVLYMQPGAPTNMTCSVGPVNII